MRSFWHFLQYNNLVPIALFVLFGGTGVALAATPQVQQAVYSQQQEMKGVDNSYIISADLAHFDFGLQITGVTEDDDNYYVAYAYKTINIVDYVWKPVEASSTLTLSKKEVEGHDLGLMVQKQLSEDIAAQISYLTQVQDKERKAGLSVRTQDTTYSGLIGARLDPTTKEFPSYVPVVAEAKIPSDAPAAAALASLGDSHDALPPSPSQADIDALVNAAVANALASAQNQNASSTPVADNTPPADDSNNPPPASTGGSAGTGGSTTPPADTGTSTPPADTGTTTPPADTGTTTPVTPPDTTASTTPPDTTSSSTPAATPPADTTPAPNTQAPASNVPSGGQTPPTDAGTSTSSGSSTPQN